MWWRSAITYIYIYYCYYYYYDHHYLPFNPSIYITYHTCSQVTGHRFSLSGSCYNSDLFKSTERLHLRAARIIYNYLSKDMASQDVLRYTFLFIISKMCLDFFIGCIATLYRVSTYFIRDQNCLLVPRCPSRYMLDSLSFRGDLYGT